MAKVVKDSETKAARMEKFHRQLRHFVSSPALFRAKCQVCIRHVSERSQESLEHLRNALSEGEIIASIIKHGRLNEALSVAIKPIRLAIEGKLLQFEWYDWINKRHIKEECVCVRVIVEERHPRHLIVTVYPDRANEIDPNIVPEVPHETW